LYERACRSWWLAIISRLRSTGIRNKSRAGRNSPAGEPRFLHNFNAAATSSMPRAASSSRPVHGQQKHTAWRSLSSPRTRASRRCRFVPASRGHELRGRGMPVRFRLRTICCLMLGYRARFFTYPFCVNQSIVFSTVVLMGVNRKPNSSTALELSKCSPILPMRTWDNETTGGFLVMRAWI